MKRDAFYFHESPNKDFPIGLLDAKKIVIYSTARAKLMTGYSAIIKDISLEHKSKIKGKENSKTKFYYEIILEDNFSKDDTLNFQIDLKKLFPNKDDKNKKLLAQFLPALTSLSKLIDSKMIVSK